MNIAKTIGIVLLLTSMFNGIYLYCAYGYGLPKTTVEALNEINGNLLLLGGCFALILSEFLPKK